MQPEDQDIEQWARQLAGDRSTGSSPEIDALRAAIRAQGDAASASVADDLARARLMKRLEQEGLFTDKKRVWQPWIGAVAAILIAVVGVRFMLLPNDVDPGSIYKGISGTVTITSEQPESSANEVLQQLKALGFKPRRLDRSDRIIIEVEVSDKQLDMFRAWAAGKGDVLAPGIYRVFVDPTASAR